MATKKIQMIPEGTDDYGTILHPETSAEQVIMNDGKTVEQSINEHKAEIATQNTAGHIKLSDIPIYTHPTTAGNKHIPSGGSAGQFLSYGGSSGTAKWEDIRNEITLVKDIRGVSNTPKTEFYTLLEFGYKYPSSMSTSTQNDSASGIGRCYIYGTNSSTSKELTIVTKNAIDLTGINLIEAHVNSWHPDNYYYGGMAYLCVSTSKTDSYSSYTARSGPVVVYNHRKQIISLNVSELNGMHYIRLHARHNTIGSYPNNISIEVAEITLKK